MLTLILQIYIMAKDNRLVSISEYPQEYITIKKLKNYAFIPASIRQSLHLMLMSIPE